MAVVMWEPSAKLDDELQLQLERHGLGNPDAGGDGDDGHQWRSEYDRTAIVVLQFGDEPRYSTGASSLT